MTSLFSWQNSVSLCPASFCTPRPICLLFPVLPDFLLLYSSLLSWKGHLFWVLVSLIPKMLMFTLAISCLTTSNLPWFMDLTFQVPMQYCSLQHQTLLPLPVSSTTGCCFALAPSLHFSGVISPLISSSILGTYWLGDSSFSVLSFCLFILFMGFSRQERWSGLPFPSPVDHALSELSTMTRLSWVALHGMTHSFIELDKAVVYVIRLVSFLWRWFSVCLSSNGEG